jgi:hypothetical protein
MLSSQIAVRLTPEDHAALRHQAQAESRSVAALARLLLQRWIREQAGGNCDVR